MHSIPIVTAFFLAGAFAAPAPVPQTYTECESVLTDFSPNACPFQPANSRIGEYCDAIGKSYGGWDWGDGEEKVCYVICCYKS